MSPPVQGFPTNMSAYALVVTDMWDYHVCTTALARVNQLAPRVNAFLTEARRRGALIVHAPSGTMPFYEASGSRARQRAKDAPFAKLPANLPAPRWPDLPIDDSDGGFDGPRDQPEHSFTREHSAIQIDESKDVIIDDGEHQILYNLLQQFGRKRVLMLGVHVNMCVLKRSFGIPTLVTWQQGGALEQVALVRDLTDSMYNPAMPPMVNHFAGTDLVIRYIENTYCPTMLSSDLLGGEPFRFPADKPGLSFQWLSREARLMFVGGPAGSTETRWVQVGAEVRLVRHQAMATRWLLEEVGQNVFALAVHSMPTPYLGANPATGQVQMQPATRDRQAVWSWWYRDSSDVGEGPMFPLFPLGVRLIWCEPKGGAKYRCLNANLQNDTLSVQSQTNITPGAWYLDLS